MDGPRDGEESPDVAEERPSDAEQAARRRDRTAKDRDVAADQRDDSSMSRDESAESRDTDAASMDARDDLSDRHTLGVVELRGRGRESRRRAADDRAQAGQDREQATGDREHAGSDRERAETDREQAARDREYAGTDELTGARRRGVGLEELDNEMKRARRESDTLIAAYVDVDGLKSVNDERGHAAGDEVLRTVADGLRRHMRPYDLLVRVGGDEFLCALPSISLAEARQRFDALLAELRDSGDTLVSVGYSELRDGDSADEFVKRADSALLASRKDTRKS